MKVQCELGDLIVTNKTDLTVMPEFAKVDFKYKVNLHPSIQEYYILDFICCLKKKIIL